MMPVVIAGKLEAQDALPSPGFAAFFRAAHERLDRHRQLLPELSRRAPVLALAGIALDWLVIVAAAVASDRAESGLVYLLCVVVIGSRMNALDLAWQHEAVHGNLFRRKRWHGRLDFLYSIPFFTTLKIARATHLEHHREYRDEAVSPLYSYGYWSIDEARWPRIRYRVWIWLIRPLCGYHAYTTLRDTILDLAENPRDAARVLSIWGGVIASLALSGHLRWLLLYWIVPLLIVRPPLFFWQDMAQHFGTRKSPSRDVRGFLYRLLLAPHGRGAHHNVHHLYPGIPWLRSARASALLIDDGGIDIARGFVDLSRQILGTEATRHRFAKRPEELETGTPERA